MKKLTYWLIMLSVLIYLTVNHKLNAEFIIKCSIIFMSLVIHKLGHKIMRIITRKIRFENIRDVLIESGGIVANVIIFTTFRNLHFNYSGYVVVINFSIVVVNMLPIYPLDCHNVLKSLLRMAINENIVLKITSATNWLMISLIFLLGVLQMVFFSYNCSFILTGLFLKNYDKFNLDEGTV